MSDQGERPPVGPRSEDEWWRRLYEESAPDTGPPPAPADDSLDDRFDSAAGALSRPPEGAGGPPAGPGAAPDPRVPGRAAAPGEAPPPPAVPPPPPAAPAGAVGGAVDPADRPPARPAPPEVPPPPARPPAASPGPAGPGDAAARERRPGTPPAPAPPPPSPSSPPPAPPASPPSPVPPEPAREPAAGAAVPGGPAQGAGRTEAEPPGAVPRPRVEVVGAGPPTYEPEPTALPAADPLAPDRVVPDTVLDGARYGTYTLRAASVRGDSARFRGAPRSDALMTARFGTGEGALVLVAVAGGSRHTGHAPFAAAELCRRICTAIGRSHARLADDIRAARRDDLKSGLHRLTDRGYGRLRSRAAELGIAPEEYTAGLRCLLLPADPRCRTRVFFGVGPGGLFRLRDGAWHDLEPSAPATGGPVVGYGSPERGPAARDVPEAGPGGDRLTLDLNVAAPPGAPAGDPLPPPAEPFRFRASVARPGDTLLLCSGGLADPFRGEAALARELALRWAGAEPPGMAEFLADAQLRVKGYADDRTAVAVWEA
ncbi:protein phosphatase 2C domain-containing protein [Streptomyces sp. NPDC047999]|uniref:protein phosphatase 2C domain-containing protein n=1 Tax=Streptomyces sp. NPDC047999 TaxID=3365497 RepID=UPI003713F418